MRLAPPLVLLLLFSVAARADFRAGQAAYQRGDYETAIREWRPLAVDGDPESQYQLGRLYHQGLKDDTEAARWYRMAAERGHDAARNDLGLLYETGSGLSRDLAAAANWYRLAAEQGLVVAQGNLARLYDRGLGVTEDPAKAARWYERAATQKHAPSQYRLGQLYEEGRGLPRDSEKAAKWYRKAAAQGYAPAEAALIELERELTAGVAAPISTAAVVPEAPEPETTLADLREEAGAGDAESIYMLGRAYALGRGVKADVEEAARNYVAAAEQGHALAAYEVGFAYLRARGVDHDLVQSYRWFAFAESAGVGDAGHWREQVLKKMSKKERAEAERLVAAP